MTTNSKEGEQCTQRSHPASPTPHSQDMRSNHWPGCCLSTSCSFVGSELFLGIQSWAPVQWGIKWTRGISWRKDCKRIPHVVCSIDSWSLGPEECSPQFVCQTSVCLIGDKKYRESDCWRSQNVLLVEKRGTAEAFPYVLSWSCSWGCEVSWV